MSNTEIPKKTLLVCDVEGTLFTAKFKISGTDYASTMWQPLAHALDVANTNAGIIEVPTVEEEERNSNIEWEKGKNGKYGGSYLRWVDDTVNIHKKHGMKKSVFESVLNNATYMPGVVDFFKDLDLDKYVPVLISGGFQELIGKAQRELLSADGFVCIKHGFAACEYIWDENDNLRAWNIQPSDFKNKYAYLKLILEQYGLNETSDWIFIGDGKNDANIASYAPVSFAINPHPELAAVSTYTIDSFAEILPILKSDEIARSLSKKRGLSNKQSVIIGQRLLNAGDMKSGSFTDNFKCNLSEVKYHLNVDLTDAEHKKNMLDYTFSKIVKWISTYADDSEKFNEELESISQSNCFDYSFNGIAKIKIAKYSKDKNSVFGIYISSPDVGTKLRQAVLGAVTEINIRVEHKADESNKANAEMYISTKVPNNSYISRNNIKLESFCPAFFNEICADNVEIRIDDGIRLSRNFQKATADDYNTLMSKPHSIPLIFIANRYCNASFPQQNLQKILDYTFGSAKTYSMSDQCLRECFSEEDIGIVICTCDGEKIIFTNSNLLKTEDVISYNVKLNKREIISKDKIYDAIAIKISDIAIDECKKYTASLEFDSKQSFYNDVFQMVYESELTDKLIAGKKTSAEQMIKDVKAKTENLTSKGINTAAIERAENNANGILKSLGITDSKICSTLSGFKSFIEKGELVISVLSDVDGSNDSYPIGILQPIACAYEICINLLALKKYGNKYFDIKKTYVEAGRLIGKIKDDSLISYDVWMVLYAANSERNNCAHPHSFRKISEIEKNKEILYRAIKTVSNIL